MITYSHALIQTKLARDWGFPKLAQRGFIIGAILPDMPLLILSAGAFVWLGLTGQASTVEAFHFLFYEAFFQHPLFISGHNLFHSPVSLLFQLGAVYVLPLPSKLRQLLKWVVIGSFVHTGVDILTHYDDGPLLLWPFDWSWRFSSPVSYWDPKHFGRQFIVFEHGLDVVIITSLYKTRLLSALRTRWAKVRQVKPGWLSIRADN